VTSGTAASSHRPSTAPHLTGHVSSEEHTRRLLLAARFAYVGVVLLATLTRLHLDHELSNVAPRLARALDLRLHAHDVVDAAQNLALFAGLGAVWVVTSSPARAWASVRNATLVGFAISASVETVQLFSPVRFASLLDVTSNTLGAVGGAVTILALTAVLRAARGMRSFVGVPAFVFAGAQLGVVFL
jgi:VanZ family protein